MNKLVKKVTSIIMMFTILINYSCDIKAQTKKTANKSLITEKEQTNNLVHFTSSQEASEVALTQVCKHPDIQRKLNNLRLQTFGEKPSKDDYDTTNIKGWDNFTKNLAEYNKNLAIYYRDGNKDLLNGTMEEFMKSTIQVDEMIASYLSLDPNEKLTSLPNSCPVIKNSLWTEIKKAHEEAHIGMKKLSEIRKVITPYIIGMEVQAAYESIFYKKMFIERLWASKNLRPSEVEKFDVKDFPAVLPYEGMEGQSVYPIARLNKIHNMFPMLRRPVKSMIPLPIQSIDSLIFDKVFRYKEVSYGKGRNFNTRTLSTKEHLIDDIKIQVLFRYNELKDKPEIFESLKKSFPNLKYTENQMRYIFAWRNFIAMDLRLFVEKTMQRDEFKNNWQNHKAEIKKIFIERASKWRDEVSRARENACSGKFNALKELPFLVALNLDQKNDDLSMRKLDTYCTKWRRRPRKIIESALKGLGSAGLIMAPLIGLGKSIVLPAGVALFIGHSMSAERGYKAAVYESAVMNPEQSYRFMRNFGIAMDTTFAIATFGVAAKMYQSMEWTKAPFLSGGLWRLWPPYLVQDALKNPDPVLRITKSLWIGTLGYSYWIMYNQFINRGIENPLSDPTFRFELMTMYVDTVVISGALELNLIKGIMANMVIGLLIDNMIQNMFFITADKEVNTRIMQLQVRYQPTLSLAIFAFAHTVSDMLRSGNATINRLIPHPGRFIFMLTMATYLTQRHIMSSYLNPIMLDYINNESSYFQAITSVNLVKDLNPFRKIEKEKNIYDYTLKEVDGTPIIISDNEFQKIQDVLRLFGEEYKDLLDQTSDELIMPISKAMLKHQ